MPDLSSLLPSEEAQPAIPCPYCGSRETEVFSLFGSQLITAQYYCRACHTPFEQVKNAVVLADAARRNLAEHNLVEEERER